MATIPNSRDYRTTGKNLRSSVTHQSSKSHISQNSNQGDGSLWPLAIYAGAVIAFPIPTLTITALWLCNAK